MTWELEIEDGLTNGQWMILRARTQRVLAEAQADQVERQFQVDMLGLDFLDALEWFAAHPFPMTPSEFLIEELRAARAAGFHPDHTHLAQPRAVVRPKKYIPTAVQLRIAMAVLDKQSNSKKEKVHG